MPTSRRDFIKYGIAGAVGFGVASAIEIPILNNEIQQDTGRIQQLQQEIATAKQGQGFLTLNPKEQTIVKAIAETIIPTDASGPGADEAGVIYFIDHMLAGNYGKGGNMFLQGPFVTPQTTPVTVGGIDYSGGTIMPRLQAGTAYQYAFNPREFWRRGLVFLEDYSNSAYKGAFESLTIDNRTKVLQDLFDGKPTNFEGPTPAEFFNELHDMVVAGFWADPLYGGNIGMVGWKLIAFNANYWGDDINLGSQKLMVASTPTRLPPKSLSDLQAAGGGI